MHIGLGLGLNSRSNTPGLGEIPSDPLMFLKMNDNLTDEMGNFNGSEVGTPLYTSGLVDNCFDFDGTNGIDVTLAQSDLSTGFTFSFWLNTTNMDNGLGDFQTVFDVLPTRALPFMFDQSQTDGFIRLGWNFADVTSHAGARELYDHEKTVDMSNRLLDGEWAHIGITYHREYNMYNLYIDGTKRFTMFCGYWESEQEFVSGLYSIQGVCADDDYIYGFDSGKIRKYNITTKAVLATASLDCGANSGNGDGYVKDGKIYLTYYKQAGDPLARTEIGVKCFNASDLSVDTSFGTSGELSLTDAFVSDQTYGEAAGTDGTYNYFSNYVGPKLYKYSLDWSTYIGEIDLSDLVTNVTGSDEWKQCNYQSGGFESIVYDPLVDRFWLTYHGVALFSINSDFDIDSVVFMRPYHGGTGAWQGISNQGLRYIGRNSSGEEEFWVADRIYDDVNRTIHKITLKKDATHIPKTWTALRLGATHSVVTDDFKNLIGQMQHFRVYGYDVGSVSMQFLAEELAP